MGDTRVPVWHPLKYVSRVRAANAAAGSNAPALLRVMDYGGHFEDSGAREAFQQKALEYAFMFAALGLPPDAR